MLLIFLNLFISIAFSAYFGFTAFHNGFFNPPQVVKEIGTISSGSFNWCSPMLWIIIINLIFIVIFLITYSKLSDKAKRILSMLAPIWTIITIIINLGAYLYN